MASAQAPAIEQAIEATSADDGKKVFVGNLDFKTTDESLKEIFAGHGTVTESQVIKKYTRSNRSLGYGFVTFSTVEEATEAISKFDKKELNGRSINVEIAKPPSHTARGSIAKQAAEAAGGEQATEGHETTGTGRRGRGGRRGGRGRGRGGRGGNRGERVPADGEADGVAANEQLEQPAEVNGEGEERSGGRGRGRGGRGRGRGRPRGPRGPPTGEPSKTLLFVANLPFSLDNDGLKDIFKGYNVVNAHVVVRRYGPVTGRSKGFGFVEVADEAEQKKVLEAFNGKEVDGRELQVKIAVEPQEGSNEAEAAAANDAPAQA